MINLTIWSKPRDKFFLILTLGVTLLLLQSRPATALEPLSNHNLRTVAGTNGITGAVQSQAPSTTNSLYQSEILLPPFLLTESDTSALDVLFLTQTLELAPYGPDNREHLFSPYVFEYDQESLLDQSAPIQPHYFDSDVNLTLGDVPRAIRNSKNF